MTEQVLTSSSRIVIEVDVFQYYFDRMYAILERDCHWFGSLME